MSKYRDMFAARARNQAKTGCAVHPMAMARLHQLFPAARVTVRHETASVELPYGSHRMDASNYYAQPEHKTLVYIDLDGNGKSIIFGKAICHPADNYDRRRGIEIAFRRALDIARKNHRGREWEAAQLTQGKS